MSGTTDNICDAFHDAAYVYCDPELQIAVVWNGSSTFNIYTLPDCQNVDVFTVYDVADTWDAKQRCQQWVTDEQYRREDEDQ